MADRRSRTLAKWSSWIVLAGFGVFVFIVVVIAIASR